MAYEYFNIALETGVFDGCADGCLVLAMADRLPSCVKQIIADRPHFRTIIQLNHGPDKKPDIPVKSSRADICHAFNKAFLYAQEMGWSRVLVLEDDFFLAPGTASHAGTVADFVNSNRFHVYNLGRVAFVGWPVGIDGHWRAVWHGTSHAAIYSKEYMRMYIEQHSKDPAPIIAVGNDRWWNRFDAKNYVYGRPLAYQVFGSTKNSESWKIGFTDVAVRLLGLHESHIPGYAVLNALSKLIPIVVIGYLMVFVPPALQKYMHLNK